MVPALDGAPGIYSARYAGEHGDDAANNQKLLADKYLENPVLCTQCNKVIEYSKRKYKFCSSSCAASCNNKIPKRIRKNGNKKCENCQSEMGYYGKYCSRNCQHILEWSNKKKTIEDNQKVENIHQAKRYLLEKNKSCKICGVSEWLGKPILLICDHINGDSTNWNLDNLRMICSNCDATTPFYKARNKGRGRFSRRERYKLGKSF